VENVVGVFLTAHKHNAEGLKEICLDYILDNLEAVKGTQVRNRLPLDNSLSLIVFILLAVQQFKCAGLCGHQCLRCGGACALSI
jgi:hypothetical protein